MAEEVQIKAYANSRAPTFGTDTLITILTRLVALESKGCSLVRDLVVTACACAGL